MRLADMRFWTQKRLIDEEAQVFPDPGHITSALNVGAWQVQKRVMRVAPDVFRKHYYRNLEASRYRYQQPRGFIRPKQLFVKYRSTGGWVEALPGAENLIETGYYGSELRYAVTGGEIVLSIIPDVAVEDGFHLLYVPSLGMAEDDDDLQDDGLSEPLHMAVVLWAVKLLLPEGGEDNTKIDAEIVSLLDDIPTLYGSLDSGIPIAVEGLGLELSGSEASE